MTFLQAWRSCHIVAFAVVLVAAGPQFAAAQVCAAGSTGVYPICTDCEAGQYDHDTKPATACELCPAGEFSASTGATTCTACSAGTFAPGGSSNCTACAEGTLDHDESATTPCEPAAEAAACHQVECPKSTSNCGCGLDGVGCPSCRQNNEFHATRCCSVDPLPGYQQKGGCAIWAESVCPAGNGINSVVNFTTAQSLCALDGARLCTAQELLADCTKSTGCGFDKIMTWSEEPRPWLGICALHPQFACGVGQTLRVEPDPNEWQGYVGPGVAKWQTQCCTENCAAWGASTACDSGTLISGAADTPSTALHFCRGANPSSVSSQDICCTAAACPPGTKTVDGRCMACPAGTHSASINASACVACGVGKFAGVGAESCTACATGQIDYDNMAATPCELLEPCLPGFFPDENFDCHSCIVAGTWVRQHGDSITDACSTCPFGMMAETPESAKCTTCSPGSYSRTAPDLSAVGSLRNATWDAPVAMTTFGGWGGSWGSEITWTITDEAGATLCSGGPYLDRLSESSVAAIEISVCQLPITQGVTLNCIDAYGDGWGGASIRVGDVDVCSHLTNGGGGLQEERLHAYWPTYGFHGISYGSATSCTLCEAGQYDHDSNAASNCKICPQDTYSGTNSTQCTKCPTGLFTDAGSASLDMCVSSETEYVGCYTLDAIDFPSRPSDEGTDGVGLSLAVVVSGQTRSTCEAFCRGRFKYMSLFSDYGPWWAPTLRTFCSCGRTIASSTPTDSEQCGADGMNCAVGRSDLCGHVDLATDTQVNYGVASSTTVTSIYSVARIRTCATMVVCDIGQALKTSLVSYDISDLSLEEAKLVCCGTSCQSWDQCANGTSMITAIETAVEGDAQAACCSTACTAGSFINVQGRCQSCEVGTASAGGDAVGCAVCPLGTFAAANSAVCAPCTAGKHDADANPSTECTLCPAGTFTLTPGKCDGRCSAGTFVESAAATKADCVLCAAGQFDDDASGISPCIDCAAGLFQCKEGATNCNVCTEPGSYSLAGASECVWCAAGQFDHDSQASTACVDCAAGTFGNNTGSTECTGVCLSGSYAAAGSTECQECTLGQIEHDNDPTSPCMECAINSFSSTLASTNCTNCPPGLVSAAGSTNASDCACPTDTFASMPNICSKCEAGMWDHDSSSASACQWCPAGFGTALTAPCDLPDGSDGILTEDTDYVCSPCNTANWPDVAASCGDCTAVILPFSSLNSVGTSYQSRCDIYCESIGRDCIQGFAGLMVSDGGTGTVSSCDIDDGRPQPSSCSVPISGLSSAVCECAPLECPATPVVCAVPAGMANQCAACRAGTYSNDTSACVTCPAGLDSPVGSTALQNCSASPLYLGCFIDRENALEGRDMTGKRFAMPQNASLGTCSALCAGYKYIGMQGADQCFCDNSYGSYGSVDDENCGSTGDACGRGGTIYNLLHCDMMNAVYRVPSLTCADMTCDNGTAVKQGVSTTSILGKTALDAQSICCDDSCTIWNASSSCSSNTTFMAPLADSTPIGSDAQAACCTGPCPAGSFSNQGACFVCPVGTVSASIDATECTNCSVGRTAATDSIACVDCPGGRYDHDQDARTECHDCKAGTFSTEAAASSCDGTCVPGTFAPAGTSGSEACIECSAGRVDHDSNGATICVLCPAGTAEADGQCEPCGDGLVSVAGATSCVASKPSYAQTECAAQWASCIATTGCLDAVATAMGAPATTFQPNLPDILEIPATWKALGCTKQTKVLFEAYVDGMNGWSHTNNVGSETFPNLLPPGIENDVWNSSWTHAVADCAQTEGEIFFPAGIPVDGAIRCCMAARWRATLNLEVAGDYTFKTRSAGGSAVIVDGIKVVDNDKSQVLESVNGTVTLAAGEHELTIGFAHSGGAGITMETSWTPRPGAAMEPLSVDVLSVLRTTEKGTDLPEPWLRLLSCQQGLMSDTVGSNLTGCTDPAAVNFDANMLVEDGSCEFDCHLLAESHALPGHTECLVQHSGGWAEPVRIVTSSHTAIQGQVKPVVFPAPQRTESVKSCDELVAEYGSHWDKNQNQPEYADICGEMDHFHDGTAATDPASSSRNCIGFSGGNNYVTGDGHAHAAQVCNDIGARLCTVDELHYGQPGRGTGCMATHSQIWSSTPCEGGMWSCNGDSVQNNVPVCQTDLNQNLGAGCCADKYPSPVVAGTSAFGNPLLGLQTQLQQQTLLLRTARIVDNEALGGGGINLAAVITCTDSTLITEYLEFAKHVQKGFGAGVVYADNCTIRMTFSEFDSNRNDGTGAGAIYATSSNIAVSNSEFKSHTVQGRPGSALSATCIVAETSEVLLSYVSLVNNYGADTILATAGSVLTLRHTTFTGNSPEIPTASRRLQSTPNNFQSSSATVSLWASSTADIAQSLFSGNTGLSAGAIFVANAGSKVTFAQTNFQANAGTASSAAAGAIFVTDGALINGSQSTFNGNSAASQRAAGCIFAQSSTVVLSGSSFVTNQAGQHPDGGAIVAGGALYLDECSVDIHDTIVENNVATAGAGMSDTSVSDGFSIVAPTTVQVKDVSFEPPSLASVRISPGAVNGILQGGCIQNPCPLGHSCTYTDFSITCTPCAGQEVGLDGLICEPCQNGFGPNADQTSCQPCSGNDISTFGACVPCSQTTVASAAHDSCIDCGIHRTAVSRSFTGVTNTSTDVICGCEDGRYNGSLMLHVCFADGYDADQYQSFVAAHTTSVATTDQECDSCPQDVTGVLCMTCDGGASPRVKAGFTIPSISNADPIQSNNNVTTRRVLLTSADGESVTAVFRCNIDMDLAVLRCPADPPVPGTCALGYSGYLCDSCADSFGMSPKKTCNPCEDTGYTVESLMYLCSFILALFLTIFVMSKCWKSFSWKHFARCVFQPGRILITYSQVTSQLGDVLDFTYPGVFGDVIEFLRPVMDLWGLFFRALGPSECYGVKGFVAKWMLRVVGMPVVGAFVVSCLYIYNRCKHSRRKAWTEMKSHTFMCVFFFCEYTMLATPCLIL